MAEKARIKIPESARKGEVIEIRTLFSHIMETGFRKDASGKPIPREIINKFTCTFNGKPVFSVDLEPAVSPNPYFKFLVRMQESGTFRFTWFDDNGTVTTEDRKVAVT
ncbi:MAG TPA: thiosulfate oxidation carrier complex protein SoxZ [Xanthobacteraceae bacterium]|jgi:sulfur-oxidizing protein SoxZ